MSFTPRFLTTDLILLAHRDTVARYGGDPGIRDIGLLDSALAQPRAQFGGEFLHRDLCEMAAAYVFHLAQNHAFVDGNKRVAAIAALAFLKLNGVPLDFNSSELEQMVLNVAKGQLSKAGVAEFFRARIPRIQD